MSGPAPSWRDHADAPADAPPVPDEAAPSYYGPIGDFQGASYVRNAFALGTDREVAALVRRLGLTAGHRVLDVGCGTGRHLRAAADLGIVGVGVDVAPALVAAARDGAPDRCRFVVGDARHGLAQHVGEDGFDAAWTLCQGAFGTSPAGDRAVLGAMAALVRPGGVVAVTAFHALFAARHLVDGQVFDPVHGVLHHRPEVHGPDGAVRRFPMWTTAWTAPALVAAGRACGLVAEQVVGAEPGRYDADVLALDDPEVLVVFRRPG